MALELQSKGYDFREALGGDYFADRPNDYVYIDPSKDNTTKILLGVAGVTVFIAGIVIFIISNRRKK